MFVSVYKRCKIFFRNTLVAHKQTEKPYFMGIAVLEEIICDIRKIQEKRDFFKFFEEKLWLQEVVESCQMCWISNGMQHICNKYTT